MDAGETFNTIVREHGAAIGRLARGYERDPHKQEDLVQEVLVAIWRALPSFAGLASLRTWVFRVAHNVAVTHVRAAALERRLVTLDEVASGDVRVEVESRGDVRRLAELIRTLRPIDRQVILLHLEGFTPTEIAQVTGLTPDHAGVKVHRARVALKRALEEGAS